MNFIDNKKTVYKACRILKNKLAWLCTMRQAQLLPILKDALPDLSVDIIEYVLLDFVIQPYKPMFGPQQDPKHTFFKFQHIMANHLYDHPVYFRHMFRNSISYSYSFTIPYYYPPRITFHSMLNDLNLLNELGEFDDFNEKHVQARSRINRKPKNKKIDKVEKIEEPIIQKTKYIRPKKVKIVNFKFPKTKFKASYR